MRSSASLLSRSRRPGILFQSFSTSPVCGSGYGRGKGRGDGTDDASQLGGYGGGVGRRTGFENETKGFGRGRREGGVSPLPPPPPPPPPPSVATPLPPLKNSFVPAKAKAENVPDSGQQASKVFLEADGQAAKIDSRFEDAVTEKPFKPFKPFVAIVKPPEAVGQQRLVPENVSSELLLQGAGRGTIPNARPAVPWNEDLKLHRQRGGASMDTWETRPRVVSILGEQHKAGQQGAKMGVIGSHAEAKDSVVASTTKSFQELSASPRVANNLGRAERAHGTPNVESKRANVWGSLSQILAPPGRTTSQPTPPLQSKPTSPPQNQPTPPLQSKPTSPPQNQPTPPLQSKPTSPPQNQPTPPLQSQPMTILQDHPTPPPHAAVVLQTGGLKVPLQPEAPPAQPQMQNVPDVVQPEKGPPVVTPNTQFQLSDESYVAMIRWHYNAGRFAEVDQVYEDMRADGVHVTVPTYNLLVEIYSKSGQFDKMDTVYKLMREALIKSKTSAVSPTMEQPPLVSMSSAPETEKRATRDETPEELVHAEEAAAIEVHLVEKASVPEPQISVEEATTGPGQLSPSTRDLHPQTAEPIESAPPSHTLIKEESKATGVSQGFAAPSTDTNKPEFIVPGGFLAQRVDESEGLHSFRGLLKQPPVGGLFEDSGRAGDLHPSILPNVPSAGAVAGRGRVGGLFEDSGRAGDFNPSMFPNLPSAVSVAGRGRGAPLPDASVRAVGRGRGAPQGSPGQPLVSPPASIGAKAGQKERMPHAELSREQARERAMALLAKLPERQGTPALRSLSPPRPQLSREDAVQRAVAVLQEGIDKNLSIEEERRRRGGPVDKFSDVTDFVANRFRRKGPDTTAPRTGSQSDKDRFKRQIRPRQRRALEEDVPQVPLTLREMTPEDEERLKVLDEEEQFKSALHTKFLLDFEPEYAMENFSDNPDIDDTPQISLEETMACVKPYLMRDDITEEMWEEEVKDILGKAHHLKKLVQLYAGPDRPTARQQKVKLEAIADTLPAHVLPEMADFTKMALLSLQSNPSIRLKEKERLMNKVVSGFSTF